MNIPNIINRPDFFVLENGEKAPLAFSSAEYENRLKGLRASMAEAGVDAENANRGCHDAHPISGMG